MEEGFTTSTIVIARSPSGEPGVEHASFIGDRVKRIQVLIVGCCTSVLLTLGVVVLGVGCAVLNRLAPRLRFSPD
jgi:hypothetical protein